MAGMMHGEAVVPVSRTRWNEAMFLIGKLGSHLGIQEMLSLLSVT